MSIILTPPGGTCGGPMAQSRTIGVTLKLSELALKETVDVNSEAFLEWVGEALKNEFINRMKEFRDGLEIAIIRSLPLPEKAKKENSDSSQ